MIEVAIPVPGAGLIMELFLEPDSSNGFAQRYYPPNSQGTDLASLGTCWLGE